MFPASVVKHRGPIPNAGKRKCRKCGKPAADIRRWKTTNGTPRHDAQRCDGVIA